MTAGPSGPCFSPAWPVEAPCFHGYLFRWVLLIVFYWIRGVALHRSASCSKEDSLDEFVRPCDPLSRLLFSALWLRCSQSFLMQETLSANFTCSMTSLVTAVTYLPEGPTSLDWFYYPLGRSDSTGAFLLLDAPSDGLQRVALSARTAADVATYCRVPVGLSVCFLQTQY